MDNISGLLHISRLLGMGNAVLDRQLAVHMHIVIVERHYIDIILGGRPK